MDDPPEEPQLDAIEGTDRAGLGLTETPGREPPRAIVDSTDSPPPGDFDARPATEPKPWSTSLVYREPHVGVEEDASAGDEQGHAGRPQGE